MGNGKYANRIIRDVAYIDVNTMYASNMVKDSSYFPVGKGYTPEK